MYTTWAAGHLDRQMLRRWMRARPIAEFLDDDAIPAVAEFAVRSLRRRRSFLVRGPGDGFFEPIGGSDLAAFLDLHKGEEVRRIAERDEQTVEMRRCRAGRLHDDGTFPPVAQVVFGDGVVGIRAFVLSPDIGAEVVDEVVMARVGDMPSPAIIDVADYRPEDVVRELEIEPDFAAPSAR